ncbi:MAG: MBL fold metallo-hydrolase [Parcubacteria group bacterium]|nr:MBL fold metallo-hydrolase [Parcubacteria group bacterium]
MWLSKKFVLGVLAFILILISYAVWQKGNQSPRLVFLNVGQGDAMLASLPGDIQILVDAGPSGELASKLSGYLPFYDRDIELAILTHPHADHLRGFLEIFKNYNVKNFIFSGANYSSRVYADFMEALRKEGSGVYLAGKGDVVSYRGRPILRIFSPDKVELGRDFKKIHEANIVSQLELGHRKFLLMGDAEEDLELRLIASKTIQDVDILKVGHHGSKTSTSEKLLQAARPEEAIISVGRNSYGHPNPGVLDRLHQTGAKVFRTDQVGDVVYR